MACSKIRELNGTREDWSIRVRLCRVWEAVDFKKDSDVFALETVFVDDEGDSIQGYVRKNHITRFKPLLKENEVYSIRNFKVGRSSVQYKVVPNNQRIYFNVTTSVRLATSVVDHIPNHAFFFESEDTLAERVNNNKILTDIIGCVVAAGPIERVSTGPKREIELKNNRHELMKVTLWGNISGMFDLAPYAVEDTPVIVIVTSTTVRKFKGDFSYRSTTATRVYFNLEMPEVNGLSHMFADGYEGIKPLEHNSAGPGTLAEQASVNRTTIVDLLAMEWVSGIQEHLCTFVGEIVEIDQRYGWCYISCNHCNKKVVPKSGSFLCTACNKTCAYPVIRYKLHVCVKDPTGSTTVVVFNDDIEKLVKTTAPNLMERVGTGNTELPAEINNLLGKKIVFKVKVTDYNLKDGFENYTVTKLFEEGIGDHKRKLELEDSTGHVIISNGIDDATSSQPSAIYPITPKKGPLECKKNKHQS